MMKTNLHIFIFFNEGASFIIIIANLVCHTYHTFHSYKSCSVVTTSPIQSYSFTIEI